jgi:type III pantothenate kinase
VSGAALVAIDAGNTRVKWGVRAEGVWLRTGAIETRDLSALAEAWPALPAQASAIASNVAGPQVGARLETECRERRIPLTFIQSQAEELGVRNGYRQAAQLGTDRWAALVAAHHLHPGHKLVVNAGTALTIDALSADGHFMGGVIVPGPALMRRSLDRGTAGLRLTEGATTDFPTSTPDAITSGAIQACVGAVERMRFLMSGRGMKDACIVLAGGAAPEIVRHLSPPLAIEDNLVLEGLVRIAGQR